MSGRRNRKKLGKDIRKQFGAKCYWCGIAVKVWGVEQNDPRRSTIDHLVPKSKGGKDGKNNMVLSCYQCNQLKGKMSAEEFRGYRGGMEDATDLKSV